MVKAAAIVSFRIPHPGGREEETEGETNHERLWTLGNKLTVVEGRSVGRWVSPVMGIQEGAYYTQCYMKTMNHGTRRQKTNDFLYGD